MRAYAAQEQYRRSSTQAIPPDSRQGAQYQKSVLFVWLLDLMPQSAVRAKALRAFIEFMRHADVDRDRRALWFALLNRLLEMARGGYRGEILDALEDSHHPVLSLYARLERVMPAGRRP